MYLPQFLVNNGLRDFLGEHGYLPFRQTLVVAKTEFAVAFAAKQYRRIAIIAFRHGRVLSQRCYPAPC